MKSKQPPKTTINAKVGQAMKKLQALYNDNANKIIEQAMQEKSAIENLNFLIEAMVTKDIKPTPEEPQTFKEAWNHPNKDSCKNGKKQFAKNLPIWTTTGMGNDA